MNPRLGGRPTHEYITRVQTHSHTRKTKEICGDTLHSLRTLTKLPRTDDIHNIKERFYVQEANANNMCLYNIKANILSYGVVTSANTSKPIRQPA